MDEAGDLGALVGAMGTVTVLCIGDVMLDRFIYGHVERISPEAPIPVLRVGGETVMLGGAGNVAANLAGLGAGCRFVAAIGDDRAGAQVTELVTAGLGRADGLVVEPGRQTSIKSRFVAGGQQLLRTDRETTAPVAAATAAGLLAAVEAALPHCAAVVLSDYAKGVLAPGVIRGVLDAAHSAGRPVVADPKGPDFARYRGATVLTPNRKELAEATGVATADDAQVERAARRLLAEAAVMAVVATRGERGMSVVPGDGPALHLHGEAREVFDVSGAGDTVAATIAAALGAGASLPDAARLANLAGGIVVGRVGTAPIRADDLSAAVRHQRWARGEAKVLDTAPALERVRRWRAEGRRVGFTNGCFDLLHPGHLSLLHQARAACDRLIVGLNTDASVRRLKGDGRPVQDETARAAVLAALEVVDLVVPFADDTPLRLIETLRPDVLVKGADYTVDRVVGADLVQGYGGCVVLARLAPGHSTTATIQRLAQ